MVDESAHNRRTAAEGPGLRAGIVGLEGGGARPPPWVGVSGYARRVNEARSAALARRIFEAFERRDAFVLRGLFAEDAVWRVSGRNVLAGTYRGRREIIRFLGSLPRLTDGTYSSELVDVLASDERAAVLYRARGLRHGVELDIDQLLLFTLRDGRVAAVDAYPSDPVAFDAFWSG